ncbi:MAG: phosphohydrolase [Acidobacteria bacterium]|nr:MAG: phosphohydrolase [Acidobacteriota bacterium]
MKIFAIGDPHLSFGRPKPMDVFGEVWSDHAERLAREWDRTVGEEDVVLVAGDISWAHTLEEAAPDLRYLASRRGRLKVLLKGNHDSWWTSAAKVRASLPAGLAILHRDALRLEEGVVLCGARGWNLPGLPWSDPVRDPPLYRRELARLDASLAAARRLRRAGDRLIAVLHFPPAGPDGAPTEVLRMLAEAGVDLAVYGHLHADDHAWAPRGLLHGVRLAFVASDFVRFRPVAVFDSGTGILEAGAAH